MKNLILFLCLCCFANAYSSVEEPIKIQEFQELPDTFHIWKADIAYYDDISFIRENIRDSIENPKAYLFTDGDNYSDAFVAIEAGNKYIVFNATKDCGIRDFYFERKNINNTGSEELIIYWTEWGGHNSHRGGFTYRNAGILVWDIDSCTCLFSFQTDESSDVYYQSYDEETDTYGEDSVYEVRCEKYAVELEEMQITIQLTKQTYDNECVNVSGEKYVYLLTENGFVLNRE